MEPAAADPAMRATSSTVSASAFNRTVFFTATLFLYSTRVTYLSPPSHTPLLSPVGDPHYLFHSSARSSRLSPLSSPRWHVQVIYRPTARKTLVRRVVR